MPTVHNPSGAVMDVATRLLLVEIARAHDLLIIEDDAYAFLETDPPPSFINLAPERTIHVGGFSKSIATRLRLGYLVAPLAHIDGLLEAIRATAWNAQALISSLITGWIEDGTLARSEENRRRDGSERQQLCQSVLGGLPSLAHPHACFAWLPLDKGLRAEPIVAKLKGQGVLISGAEPFATTIAVPQALRLAYGGIPMGELKDVFRIVRVAVETASVS